MFTPNKLIPRRALRCQTCEAPFSLGGRFVSFLDMQNEPPLREDFCPKCSCERQLKKEEHRWEGEIPKKEKPKKSGDKEALSLLCTLQEDDPALLTLLALYLERRGELVRRNAHLFEEPHLGTVFPINTEALEGYSEQELKEKLNALFHGKPSR